MAVADTPNPLETAYPVPATAPPHPRWTCEVAWWSETVEMSGGQERDGRGKKGDWSSIVLSSHENLGTKVMIEEDLSLVVPVSLSKQTVFECHQ